MFGYVVMNKPEIRFKDFDLYRSFYCGLCRELREKYGISGQITLTYDMTFVVVLLSALYEPPTQKGTTRCVIHPVCRQPVRKNAATEYGADMNVLLTYYKCMDDWEDEKKFAALGYGKILQRKNNRLSRRYPEKAEKIGKLLEKLSQMAQTCREFEKLPIMKYTDILRNILYSGVWCRFETIARKRREAGEKKHD